MCWALNRVIHCEYTIVCWCAMHDLGPIERKAYLKQGERCNFKSTFSTVDWLWIGTATTTITQTTCARTCLPHVTVKMLLSQAWSHWRRAWRRQEEVQVRVPLPVRWSIGVGGLRRHAVEIGHYVAVSTVGCVTGSRTQSSRVPNGKQTSRDHGWAALSARSK